MSSEPRVSCTLREDVIGEASLLPGGEILYAGSGGSSAGGLKAGGGGGGESVESEGIRWGRSAG